VGSDNTLLGYRVEIGILHPIPHDLEINSPPSKLGRSGYFFPVSRHFYAFRHPDLENLELELLT